MVEYSKFIEWCFLGLISYHFMNLDRIMKGLKSSVDELSITIAVQIGDLKNITNDIRELKEQLKEHDDRIHNMEIRCASHEVKCKKKE